MLFAPLEGWRHVEVTDRHTAVDYAHVLKDLADRRFPHAKTIVLVQLHKLPTRVEARLIGGVKRAEYLDWGRQDTDTSSWAITFSLGRPMTPEDDDLS